MEELKKIKANDQPIAKEKKRISRDNIFLGKANGYYMDCTIEDVRELQKRNLALLRKIRDKFNSEYGMHSNDFIIPTLAEFENPCDELYNLLNQTYNNTYAGWGALSQSAEQDREIKRLFIKVRGCYCSDTI